MDRPHFVYPFICRVAFSLAIMNNAATNIHIQVLMRTYIYIYLGLIPRSRNAGSNDKTLVAQSCPTLSDPMDCKPTRFLCPWDSPGQNTGVGCHSLPQRIFRTQGSNPALSYRRQILYHLSHQGSSYIYTAGSYGNSMLSLLRNLQTLPRCCNHFTFLTAV